MQTIVSVPGIHCASCAALIKDVSNEFPSIKDINVDIDSKKVTIDHDESFEIQSWTKELESLGDEYKVFSL